MIERLKNVVTITLPDEKHAEAMVWLLTGLLQWTEAVESRLFTPPSPKADAQENNPNPPLKRRGPLSPHSLAASERVIWNRHNLKEFDRQTPDSPGENFLPPHRRPSKST